MTWIQPILSTPPQGWQCPVCKRVYAPATIMCVACPQQVTTTPDSIEWTQITPNTCDPMWSNTSTDTPWTAETDFAEKMRFIDEAPNLDEANRLLRIAYAETLAQRVARQMPVEEQR